MSKKKNLLKALLLFFDFLKGVMETIKSHKLDVNLP